MKLKELFRVRSTLTGRGLRFGLFWAYRTGAEHGHGFGFQIARSGLYLYCGGCWRVGLYRTTVATKDGYERQWMFQ